MGDDVPLPVLAGTPHMLYDYFKQRFAQVGALWALCLLCCAGAMLRCAALHGGPGVWPGEPAWRLLHRTACSLPPCLPTPPNLLPARTRLAPAPR